MRSHGVGRESIGWKVATLGKACMVVLKRGSALGRLRQEDHHFRLAWNIYVQGRLGEKNQKLFCFGRRFIVKRDPEHRDRKRS